MTCPKCGGSMSTFDRLGVHVEQCVSCKGIFLDYGELEQIVDAEQQFNTQPPPLEYGAPPAADRGDRPESASSHGNRFDSPGPYRGRPDSPGPFSGGMGGFDGGYRDSPRPYGKKRRKSIFDQLFD